MPEMIAAKGQYFRGDEVATRVRAAELSATPVLPVGSVKP